MNRMSFALATGAAFALALPLAVAAEDPKLPLRKAGQWEIKTIMDQGAGPMPEHSMQMCIDARMEEMTADASRVEHQTSCSSYKISAADGKTIVEADCKFPKQSIQSRTEMSGDFQTEFSIRIESTTTNESTTGQSQPAIKRVINQKGRYASEKCQDGLQPGEAVAADGTKMLVQ